MKYSHIIFYCAFITKCILICYVSGHARLLDPPQRSSLWRLGYKVPVNFNDNEVFCGGYRNLVEHGGKCGVCGDPYQGPRDHETGGKFASGIIVRHFPVKAAYINARVEVTAHHKGFFEFRICPQKDAGIPITQECLDDNILSIVEGRKQGTPYRYYPPQGRFFDLHVEIPDGLICRHCVLQWVYKAGNSWGKTEAGKACIGCGHQELFVNCADVSIGTNAIKHDSKESSEESEESEESQRSGSEEFIWDIYHNFDKALRTNTGDKKPPSEHVSFNSSKTSILLDDKNNTSTDCNRCYALPTWGHFPEMNDWCDRNCKAGNCPSCRCYCGCPDASFHNPCSGGGLYKNNVLMDDWCWRECCETDCPRDKCTCSKAFNKTGFVSNHQSKEPIKKLKGKQTSISVHGKHSTMQQIVSVLKTRGNIKNSDKLKPLKSVNLPEADVVKDMKFLDFLRKSMESWVKTAAT